MTRSATLGRSQWHHTRRNPRIQFRHGATGAPATGAIVYRGPSLINGRPILAVATFASNNKKTGNMVQVWILPDAGELLAALRDPATESSICGDCRHSLQRDGSCYVDLPKAPRGILAGVARSIYPDATDPRILPLVGRGREVRLGAYGDPCAIPVSVALALVSESTGHTGYTHRWRDCFDVDAWRGLCMASVDTESERTEARALGWRTFRPRSESATPATGEIDCPAYTRGAQCADCLLCAGTARPARDITVPVHGISAQSFTGD